MISPPRERAGANKKERVSERALRNEDIRLSFESIINLARALPRPRLLCFFTTGLARV